MTAIQNETSNLSDQYDTANTQLQPNRRVVVGALGVLAALSVVGGLVFYSKKNPSNQPIISQATQNKITAPTPMPFEEMTIPYLQKKKFESSLGQLQEIEKQAQFTSYLTSYTSDDLKINGLLTKPSGEMPAGGWPAIVFIHGYIPPTLYKTTQSYASYVSALAQEGFVVFKIDLRGHDQSQGEPGGAYYSSDYIVDTLNAVAALQTSGFVNPDSIGLWGHSMAGNVVARSIAAQPNLAAAVIWAGAVYTYEDMTKYGIDDNSYRPPITSSQRQQRRQLLRDTHGDFTPNDPFWKQVAITDYVNDIKTPLQIHHAIDDPVVNIGYSRDLMSLLDKTAVKHELYEYPSGGHNLTGNTFNQAMQRSIAFYKENL